MNPMRRAFKVYGVKRTLQEFHRYRTVSVCQAIGSLLRKAEPYEWVPEEQWKSFKKSDTIFVFGAGPSINDLTEDQWGIIRSHDSFGINFAFLCGRPLTYNCLGYEPNNIETITKVLNKDVRTLTKNSLWFLATKALVRLVHPRLAPNLFPYGAHVALHDLPPAVRLDSDRPFLADDFALSLAYRGTMGLALHLVSKLGYKRIVLLGVDLHTHHHFFDQHPLVRDYYVGYNQRMAVNGKYESMVPKGDKYRTMEEYYYAVNDLFFKPRGVQLFVGNRGNLLSPRISHYPDFAALNETLKGPYESVRNA